MLCYDGIFGKVFEAEESDVKLAVERLNLRLKHDGYLFLKEYQEELKKLNEDNGLIEPSSEILNTLSYKAHEDDTFVLRFGMLNDSPVLIIQANYHF